MQQWHMADWIKIEADEEKKTRLEAGTPSREGKVLDHKRPGTRFARIVEKEVGRGHS